MVYSRNTGRAYYAALTPLHMFGTVVTPFLLVHLFSRITAAKHVLHKLMYIIGKSIITQ
jgi:general stress protein CsbA